MPLEMSYFFAILLILGILLLLWWFWKIVTATATVTAAFSPVNSGPAGTSTTLNTTVQVGGVNAPDGTPVTVAVVDADGHVQPSLNGTTVSGVAAIPFTVPVGAAVGIWEFTPSALGTTGAEVAFTLSQQKRANIPRIKE